MENYQLVIHIQDKSLGFDKPEDFSAYVKGQVEQGEYTESGLKIQPWLKFEHLPLLKIVDDSTKEEFSYKTYSDLPTATVRNAAGRALVLFGSDPLFLTE